MAITAMEELFDNPIEAEMIEAIVELEGLRTVLDESYADADYDELAALHGQILSELSDEEAEFLKRAFRSIGRTVRRALPTISKVAQVALPAVGGLVGGPVGAVAGQAGASLVGQLARSNRSPQVRRGRRLTRRMRSRRRGRRRPRASARALGFLQNPRTIQAIGSLVTGRHGRGAVRSGGGNIPIAGLMNLASQLFAQAAAEAAEEFPQESMPDYLLDADGAPVDGIEDGSRRAELLWEHLEDSGFFDSDDDEGAAFMIDDALDELDALTDQGWSDEASKITWR